MAQIDQEKSRAELDPDLKWNPGVLYVSAEEWAADRDALLDELGQLVEFRGTLQSSTERLKSCLTLMFALSRRLLELWSYASRLHDEDTRRSDTKGMVEAIQKIGTDYEAAVAFIEPEIIGFPDELLEQLPSDPLLAEYDRYLLKLVREKAHVLSDAEETILAGAGIMGSVPSGTYGTFTNADLKFPEIVDHQGKRVQLSQAMYQRYRQSDNRQDRQTAFEAFWATYGQFKNTFASLLSGQVKYNDFVARTRHYDSALEASLQPKGIPDDFYRTFCTQIKAHLGLFQRYLALRRGLLGIEGAQYYYDIYPSLVASQSRVWNYSETLDLLCNALEPLGSDYVGRLRAGLTPGSGWIDVYPSPGKRTGAYSSSVYGKHPLVLMNFTDDWNSVSTLAHELGHALHSVYSNESQPYAKSRYPIFLAEVASIVNETLLVDELLESESDPGRQAFYLSEYLNGFRGTVFRQIMFAEFELSLYERFQRREPLTADALNQSYLELLRHYHGHDQGVMDIEERYAIEWAYVPHFYYNFYVYQYASGFIAATALVQQIREQGSGAADRYINELLRAGQSRDPLDTLQAAGVDLMSPEPYRLAMATFEKRLAQLEQLSRVTSST